MKQLHKKRRHHLLVATDVIFEQLYTYNDMNVRTRLISSIIFFISSICRAFIISDVLCCSSINRLVSSSSLLRSSIFYCKHSRLALCLLTSLEWISCEYKDRELLLLFQDLGLGAQPSLLSSLVVYPNWSRISCLGEWLRAFWDGFELDFQYLMLHPKC